jgi:hypothetical protein
VTPRRCLVPLVLALALLVAPPSASAYVYFGAADSIGRVDNDGTGADPNFIAGADPFAPLAVDAAHLVYTTDQEGQNADPIIGRTNLDGGEATTLPDGFLAHSGSGIGAVDAEHVYWVSNGGIGRAKLDGSSPELEYLVPSGLIGGIAVYNGYIYWTVYQGGAGEDIGRASLSTKIIDNEFVELVGESGPRAIAVDADGIFWTWSGGGPYEGKIGHASLGGGTPVLDEIPGADVGTASGIAITGSDLYWFNFEEGFGVSLAHADLQGSGSTIDRHFIDHVGYGSLAANAAGPAPTPAPPPPPTSGQSSGGPGSSAPSTPPPLKELRAPKVKLNRKTGSATLTVVAPGPGKLALSGAGVRSVRKTVKAAGAVALTVRPTAKTAAKLKATGTARVAVKLTFTPLTGNAGDRVVNLKLRESTR